MVFFGARLILVPAFILCSVFACDEFSRVGFADYPSSKNFQWRKIEGIGDASLCAKACSSEETECTCFMWCGAELHCFLWRWPSLNNALQCCESGKRYQNDSQACKQFALGTPPRNTASQLTYFSLRLGSNLNLVLPPHASPKESEVFCQTRFSGLWTFDDVTTISQSLLIILKSDRLESKLLWSNCVDNSQCHCHINFHAMDSSKKPLLLQVTIQTFKFELSFKNESGFSICTDKR